MMAGGGMPPHCPLQNPMEVKGLMGLSAAHLEASIDWKWMEMGRSLWSKGRDKSKGPQGMGVQKLSFWEKKGVLLSVKAILSNAV